MPRIAVCSDVHSQADAFEAVLEDARGRGVDEVWCLGDLVGGGPHPGRVVDLARECDLVLLGNHDAWMLEGRMWEDERVMLDREQLKWLGALAARAVRHDVQAWHGSPSDHLNGFVTAKAAVVAMRGLPAGSCGLVGHTHEPALWTLENDQPRGVLPRPDTPINVPVESTVIANPGAVAGGAHDGAPWWVRLDIEERTFTWHRLRRPRVTPASLRLNETAD